MDNTGETEVETAWLKDRRRQRALRFLKGPISLVSLQVAAQLPGKAMVLYLAIRHRADLRRSPEVTLPAGYLAAWNIRKDAKSRALVALENAGLVKIVSRQPGQSTKVTLCK